MLQLFKATLETRHFDFEVVAYSKVEALYILQQTWLKHRMQTGATMQWSEIKPDVQVREIIVNAGYRDGEILHRKAK